VPVWEANSKLFGILPYKNGICGGTPAFLSYFRKWAYSRLLALDTMVLMRVVQNKLASK